MEDFTLQFSRILQSKQQMLEKDFCGLVEHGLLVLENWSVCDKLECARSFILRIVLQFLGSMESVILGTRLKKWMEPGKRLV